MNRTLITLPFNTIFMKLKNHNFNTIYMKLKNHKACQMFIS